MKSIVRTGLIFFGTFIFIYIVLVLISLNPSVAKVTNKMYRVPTQPILSGLLSKAMIELKTDAEDPGLMYVQYYSKKEIEEQKEIARQSGQNALNISGNSTKIDLNSLFYTFWLFFVVLMALSPIALKSKLIKLLIGTVVIYLYTLIKTWMSLLITMSHPEIGIYDLSGFGLKFIRFLLPNLSVGINLLVVLIIWVLLVFNKDNWQKFLKLFD